MQAGASVSPRKVSCNQQACSNTNNSRHRTAVAVEYLSSVLSAPDRGDTSGHAHVPHPNSLLPHWSYSRSMHALHDKHHKSTLTRDRSPVCIHLPSTSSKLLLSIMVHTAGQAAVPRTLLSSAAVVRAAVQRTSSNTSQQYPPTIERNSEYVAVAIAVAAVLLLWLYRGGLL